MPPVTACAPAIAAAIELLPPPMDTGTLGVHRLKRAWARARPQPDGRPIAFDQREFHLDHLVFDALGIGLEQTMQFLGRAPGFEEFERWIVATTGGVPPIQIARINAALAGTAYPREIEDWLTLVPGFHRRIGDWLARLPEGADPRRQNLHALGSQPVAGRAGDLVIWHGALPHGSRPNRARMPRIVQYIRMYPTAQPYADVWK